MQAGVKLGLGIVAVALSARWAQAEVTVHNPGATSTSNTVVSGPSVAKTPSPGGPVPIPYPNIGSTDKEDQAAKKPPLLKNNSKFTTTTGDEAGTLKGLADKKELMPIEVVKPDVPKPENVPPVDVVKRPLPTPPLRPVEVPHPVKLPQPIHRPIDLPQPVLRPVELPAKPVLPVKPIEPVKLPQPIKIEQPVRAQPVILQPAAQMPVQR